ncbi:multidrug transporter subunit MdtN [Halomonas halocynthiae]|uniref:multidrug transporter subunit MdtN n=1 Tax=Halomonas halocynthiae TaxID=176290 RepID=UPI00041638E0|nr:multidrug transporter subunit MdtN [Halomonas halocynthiae]
MKTHASKKAVSIVGAVIAIVIIVGAAVMAYQSYENATANPLSDDAALIADVVRVAPSVAGRVTALHVEENDFVREGELLFEIDDTAYQLALEQAEADLAMAIAAGGDHARNILAEQANAEIAEAQISRARANLALANQTLGRLLPMESKGYVSTQQIHDARTVKRNAEISLQEALKQRQAADALVGNDEATRALINARQAAVGIMQHELAGTRVYAPADGRIVGVRVSEGDYVMPAQPQFNLIRTDTWYASANFTETILENIAVGNCATVYALANRQRAIKGTVVGIGWGVASKSLIELPVSLPIVPKSLDWVRVQQRFPVRIRLENPPAELMRVGASAVVTVHHADDC